MVAQWPDQTAGKSGHFTALRSRLPFTKCGCHFYTVPKKTITPCLYHFLEDVSSWGLSFCQEDCKVAFFLGTQASSLPVSS